MTARWRDPSWTYHKAETHSDPAQFKARMREYAKLPQPKPEPSPNKMLGLYTEQQMNWIASWSQPSGYQLQQYVSPEYDWNKPF